MSALSRLNAQLRGNGDRAMVFAHGFGCDQSVWQHVAPHFEAEFVTVLFDHAGSGRADRSVYSPDKYSTLKGYAQDVVDLGRAVPFEDAVLVGHSCGAMIGLLASIEAPKMFKSLVLLSASPRYVDDADYSDGFTKKEVLGTLRELRDDFAGWSERMAPIFMGNSDRPALADQLLRSFRRTDPNIAAEFGAAIFTSDWRSELQNVTADCLVIQCERDPVVPLSVGQFLRSHIHNCQLQTLAIDGHFPHLSAPDRVVDNIRRFIDAAPPVRATAANGGRGRHAADKKLASGAGLRLSTGKWSRRRLPISERASREELEDRLMKRAGELLAQFGRYDMYALAVERWLERSASPANSKTPANVNTRAATIMRLMLERRVPEHIISHYQLIHAEMREILGRHEISAKNSAIVPALRFAGDRASVVSPRKWYEYGSASDQEIHFFIDALDRDILHVASLYLRLSELARLLAPA